MLLDAALQIKNSLTRVDYQEVIQLKFPQTNNLIIRSKRKKVGKNSLREHSQSIDFILKSSLMT